MVTCYGLSLVTAPTSEPVTLAEAKKQCEIAAEVNHHDEHLERLIQAARVYVENYTGRQIVTATWDLYADSWPDDGLTISLPKGPIQSVTSITYVDENGSSQTWGSSNYVLSASREPAIIRLAYQALWPAFRFQPDAIRVRYVAGYGAATAVPQGIKHAILLLVGGWFLNREIETTSNLKWMQSAENLLQQYRYGDEWTEYGDDSYGVSE